VDQCQNINSSLRQRIHQRDFHEILRFIQIYWNYVFVPQGYCTQRQRRIISQAILARNQICHQDFLAMHYLDLLKKLKSLALMINCDQELIDMIDDDFYRVSASQVPLADDARRQFHAQAGGYVQRNTPEKAIEYYSEQIFRDVNDATSYYERAWYEYELKQYDLALEDLEEAVDLDKGEKTYIHLRNGLLFQLKQESNFRLLFHWFYYKFMWFFRKLFFLVKAADVTAQQSINKIRISDEAIDIGASFYYGEDGLEKNLTLAQICWSKVRTEKVQ
jgi:tetratricopeptide (TPR) repeat protein